MVDIDKERIRPLYAELQGLLSQAPKGTSIDNAAFWNHFNELIDELNDVSGKDYSRFKLTPISGDGFYWLHTSIYCTKLGGLISRLHVGSWVHSGGALRTYDLALKVSGQYGVLLPLHPRCSYAYFNLFRVSNIRPIRSLCRGLRGRQ